jgi:hypothetical protein
MRVDPIAHLLPRKPPSPLLVLFTAIAVVVAVVLLIWA